MKIVITGGLGFIGQHLCRQLLSEGKHVVLIDSLTTQIHGDIPIIDVPIGAKVVRMDIGELAERYEIIDGADVIFHLAAETGTAQSMYQILHYTRVNCDGTAALLEAIAKCSRRPKKVILASSRSVYGEGAYTRSYNQNLTLSPITRTRERLEAGCWEPVDSDGQVLTAIPTPETLPFSPGSIYAATKAAQELLIRSATVALGINSTIFRFQNVYGEGQSLLNPYTGIISIFFNRARQGLQIPIYEDGKESRDFIHVKDVVSALIASLKNETPSGVTLNVGSGKPTTVLHLAKTLLKVSGFDVPVNITGQYRMGDIRHCFADLSLIKKHLDFSPKISLEQGLRNFCDWAITQPTYNDYSANAVAELKKHGLTN